MPKAITLHELRILDVMEPHKWFNGLDFIKAGFRQGVHGKTLHRLTVQGFLECIVCPAKGHEDDWSETGHYWLIHRKIKDPRDSDYQI